jgi:hypothetical protein
MLLTVGLKLNTHAFYLLYVLYCRGGCTGTGCLLKAAVGIFIRGHKRAVKLCLTTLWPGLARSIHSPSPKAQPLPCAWICVHLHPATAGAVEHMT